METGIIGKTLDAVTVRVCKLNGEWREWNENWPIEKKDTATVTIAPLTNVHYTRHIQNQFLDLGLSRRKRDLDTQSKIVSQGLARHVVKNWTEFTLDGKPLPCNEKTVLAFFERDSFFKSFVTEIASEQDRFIEEVVTDQVKNS